MNIADISHKKSEQWLKKIEEMREMFLANLVMLCQIPSPTFYEEKRAEFILNRYIEAGLSDPCKDECNNVIGLLPGKKSDKKIMINAHMDNIFKLFSFSYLSLAFSSIVNSFFFFIIFISFSFSSNSL